jgi:isocitrate/isopropylmalate dehydrogenase
MLPSASLGAKNDGPDASGPHEPVRFGAGHCGQGLANPIPCASSFAMCLRYSSGER